MLFAPFSVAIFLRMDRCWSPRRKTSHSRATQMLVTGT